MAGEHVWQGGVRAGEMATEAGGMHPTIFLLTIFNVTHQQIKYLNVVQIF